MKKALFLILFFTATSQAEEIKWMTFTEAVAAAKKQPKKIFIDVYTHWCGWCKRMDATTFKDSAVAAYMNTHYYCVKFDAETRDSILFREHYFTYKPDYKANELAISLLNGNMGYPSFVVLDGLFNMVTTLSGYQTTEQLLPALRYFAEDKFKTQTFEEYQKEIQKK